MKIAIGKFIMKKEVYIQFIVLFVLLATITYGQERPRVEKNEVIAEAKNQLIFLTSAEGDLNKFCQLNNIKGEFVVDFTLQGKGKILTVFMVSSTVEEIKYQNLLKSRLAEIEFENIKIPKNERIKFRQTFTF